MVLTRCQAGCGAEWPCHPSTAPHALTTREEEGASGASPAVAAHTRAESAPSASSSAWGSHVLAKSELVGSEVYLELHVQPRRLHPPAFRPREDLGCAHPSFAVPQRHPVPHLRRNPRHGLGGNSQGTQHPA